MGFWEALEENGEGFEGGGTRPLAPCSRARLAASGPVVVMLEMGVADFADVLEGEEVDLVNPAMKTTRRLGQHRHLHMFQLLRCGAPRTRKFAGTHVRLDATLPVVGEIADDGIGAREKRTRLTVVVGVETQNHQERSIDAMTP
jgi:hypothetical protein